MNTTIKYGAIVVLAALALVVGALLMGYMSTLDQATRLEAQIQQQWPVCLTVIDTTYQAVRTENQIADAGAQDIKDYLTLVFVAPDQGAQQAASSNLIAAVAKYSVLGDTDLLSLRLKVMQTVEAGLMGDWRSCMARMNDLKSQYSIVLGLPAGAAPGQTGSFPNSMFASWGHLPRHLAYGGSTSPQKDLDGDGDLTAFDYPSKIVSAEMIQIEQTGELPALLPTPVK